MCLFIENYLPRMLKITTIALTTICTIEPGTTPKISYITTKRRGTVKLPFRFPDR